MEVSLSWRSTSDVYHAVSTTHTPRFLSAFLIVMEGSFLRDVTMVWRVLLRGVKVNGMEVSRRAMADRTVER